MEGSEKQKKVTRVRTFPVSFPLDEIKENITVITKTSFKPSKEELMNQAFKFHTAGNILEATKYYQHFLNQGFKNHRVLTNYESILKSQLSKYKPSELNSDIATTHYNLGNVLRDLGNLTEAEQSYRKAIELKSDFIDAHLNLGLILKNLGKIVKAEQSFRKAIELKPDFADAHLNLGNLFKDHDKLLKAEQSYRKAIELKPHLAKAHSNLGIILKDLGNLEEAELSLNKAIAIKPDFADAYFNLSHLELLQGKYPDGLEHYEFRLKKKKPISVHGSPIIRKINDIVLPNEEKLLVISEQGLGDILQYMRYVPYLKNQGLDVSFCSLPKLHSLIQASGIDLNPLTPAQANIISEGRWIPLLSLPRYLKISPNNPIISEPYIHSTVELNQKWKSILSTEKKPIIGINWQGNPEMEKTYQGRSIPLEKFSILAELKQVTLLSLQKVFGLDQIEQCSFANRFVECQPEIDVTCDFLENAAIIHNCDLIITCDTSIAHLAGGMGKKVWLLLKDIPFWTWGLEKESTFWYPSMRLFRQKERHNWQEVMERVSNALKKELNSSLKYRH